MKKETETTGLTLGILGVAIGTLILGMCILNSLLKKYLGKETTWVEFAGNYIVAIIGLALLLVGAMNVSRGVKTLSERRDL